jgi:oxygen-independent coproporphyrinogen-3 oxidase
VATHPQLFSIYLHFPFCVHRCGYCDFNTYAGLEALIPPYIKALCDEIRSIKALVGDRLVVHTVFFGGGTPSLLLASQLESLLVALTDSFRLVDGAEISLEANPGTLTRPGLKAYHDLGINRLSLGVQSADAHELQLLERQHDFFDVIQAVDYGRQAGFENINLDLIFGLPDQPISSWQRSVERALRLQPDHFSLYALTLEHGTPFGHWAERGLLTIPDADLAAEMYEWASERLELEGFIQYEISNWGRRKLDGEIMACRHNLQYWRNLPYLGFGAGAHGYADRQRVSNVLSPAVYIKRFAEAPEENRTDFPITPATVEVHMVDEKMEIAETMMMGLRLVQEGIASQAFFDRFGRDLDEVFPREIEKLMRVGLLEWAGANEKSLRLTRVGRLLGNRVFMEFV